ncbi:MAG: hypothetical protein KAQ63_02800 [Candidatus Moranbacteria bacterium]|nr:hypothetical protein [Candidatus Moranbacteria bacterium]
MKKEEEQGLFRIGDFRGAIEEAFQGKKGGSEIKGLCIAYLISLRSMEELLRLISQKVEEAGLEKQPELVKELLAKLIDLRNSSGEFFYQRDRR